MKNVYAKICQSVGRRSSTVRFEMSKTKKTNTTKMTKMTSPMEDDLTEDELTDGTLPEQLKTT